MEDSSAMKLHLESGRRTVEISPTVNRQPLESIPRDLADCDVDVIDIIMSFVGIHAYLSVASVSTRWRHAWGERPRVTSPKWAVQTFSCLDWSRACGLDISNGPCLLAAADGRLDILQHAVVLGYSRQGMPICERAAAGGHLEVLKWCRASGYPWGLSKLLAAEGGHLEVLQWCIAQDAPEVARTPLTRVTRRGSMWQPPGLSNTAVFNAAVKGGHHDTVIWCWQQGYRWDGSTCYLAAKGGHLHVLKLLRLMKCPWSPTTMIGAANAGDLEMLKWCRANGSQWNSRIQSAIARRGDLEIIKWFVDVSLHVGSCNWTCLDAAAYGHLEVVQWLRGMGFPWGDGLCFLATCGGHFEVLKWCIANGCLWDNVPSDENSFEFHGTVPMMLWATENGCPWMADPSAVNSLCWHAARGGNLEVLKWFATFHSISCSKALWEVAPNGHVHVLEWLRANTRLLNRCMEIYSRLCCMAAISGSLEMVKWCRQNNYPWYPETCTAAARSGNLELLQWCRANGCPWGDDTCKEIIKRGDFEMLAWCRKNGCPRKGKGGLVLTGWLCGDDRLAMEIFSIEAFEKGDKTPFVSWLN